MPTQSAEHRLTASRVWRHRRWMLVALTIAILWTPLAIGTAILMERTGWWRSPQALGHPPLLKVGFWLSEGPPRFELGTTRAEGYFLLRPPWRTQFSRFGPLDTHRIVEQNESSVSRKDGATMSREDLSKLRRSLIEFLLAHPDPKMQSWAKHVTATSWRQETVFWSGRLVNGSIVLACFLMAVLIPRALWLLIRAFCLGRGMLCPHCAYDLSATPGPVCPECGAANPFSTA